MHKASPILVAEDNEDDFYFFRRAVRAAAIENPVLRFRDGSELVYFISKLRPDEIQQSEPWLTFVDITMPIMNGFEVLEWIASKKAKYELLPIVLSGSNLAEDMKRAFALGAYEYLVKPIAPAVLAAIASRPFESLKIERTA